jgi:hypothetical protein
LPFFKTAKPFKNLGTAPGILSVSDFNHIVRCCGSFPLFLTKFNAHSFLFLGHSECYDETNAPVLCLGYHKTENSWSKGTDCEKVRTCQHTF